MSKAEYALRLDLADRMLRDGRSRADVVKAMRAEFGSSTRAADAYMRRTRDRWTSESAATRPTDRDATIARLEHLSGKAEKRGAFAAAVGAERLLADVRGVRAPERVEVHADVASAPAPRELSWQESMEEIADSVRLVTTLVEKGILPPAANMRRDALALIALLDTIDAPVDEATH